MFLFSPFKFGCFGQNPQEATRMCIDMEISIYLSIYLSTYTYTYMVYYKKLDTWLWNLTSNKMFGWVRLVSWIPTGVNHSLLIWAWKSESQQGWWYKFYSEIWKLKTRDSRYLIWVQRQEKKLMPQPEAYQACGILPYLGYSQSFCFIQTELLGWGPPMLGRAINLQQVYRFKC